MTKHGKPLSLKNKRFVRHLLNHFSYFVYRYSILRISFSILFNLLKGWTIIAIGAFIYFFHL